MPQDPQTMTALIYTLQPDRVCIATDSLALRPDKGALNYCTKIFLLPHLGMVLCGTGLIQLVLDWFCFLESSVVAKDLMDVNDIAPDALVKIWREKYAAVQMTATIYQFGYNESEKRFDGFAYRSENDFKAERLLRDSIGIKPGRLDLREFALECMNEKGVPQAFVETIEKLKLDDDNRPHQDKLGIGGEIHFLTLDRSGYVLSICHRFDDYYEIFDDMLRNLQAR